MRLKLRRIVTGTKSKLFDTEQGVYVANIESSYDNFQAYSGTDDNKFCIFDNAKSSLLKNIYLIDQFTRHSYANYLESYVALEQSEETESPSAVITEPVSSNTFNISTASIWQNEHPVNGVQGLMFSDDGDTMWTIDSGGDILREHSLSLPFDISTASIVQDLNIYGTFSGEGVGGTPADCQWNDDGSRIFILDTGQQVIWQYSASGYDISTLSGPDSTYNMWSVLQHVPLGFNISPDGKHMATCGYNSFAGTSGEICTFSLGTEWDITTISFTHRFSIKAYEDHPKAIWVHPSGKSFIIIGNNATAMEFVSENEWTYTNSVLMGETDLSATGDITLTTGYPASLYINYDSNEMFIGCENQYLLGYTVTPEVIETSFTETQIIPPNDQYTKSPKNTIFKRVTQWNEVGVGITKLDDIGTYYLRYNNDYNLYGSMNHPVTVAIFPPSGTITPEDSNIKPLYVLSGIEFNFMEEIPVEFKLYDFSNGIMYTNSMNMKNMYDYKWDVSGLATSATEASATSASLTNTRYYTDINSDSNNILYNIYRFKNDYEGISGDVFISEAEYINENPYFYEWNPESTILCGWTASGGLSSYVNVFTDDLSLKYNFPLFNSVVMSGNSYLQYDQLSAGHKYYMVVDVFDLSGTLSVLPSLETITTTGTHIIEYDSVSTESLYLSTGATTSAVINKFVVTENAIVNVTMDVSNLLHDNFDNWDFTEDTPSAYYLNPVDWYDVNTVNGNSYREFTDFLSVRRQVGDFNYQGYVTIPSASTLSSDDKTYAILIKTPTEVPVDEFGTTLLGGASDAYHIDNIAFKSAGSDFYDTYDPCMVWRGGAPLTANVWDSEGLLNTSAMFDNRWKWIIFRKDLSADTMYMNYDDIESNFVVYKMAEPTYVERIGYSNIGGSWRPKGNSRYKFSRFYTWSRVLADNEVSGIIRMNNIPSGYDIGYHFDEASGTTIIDHGPSGYHGTVTHADIGNFWGSTMEVAVPQGKLHLHMNNNGHSAVSVMHDDVFTTSGWYDIHVSVSDYISGSSSRLLLLEDTTDPITTVTHNGETYMKYYRTSTSTSGISISAIDSDTINKDIIINEINVTKIDDSKLQNFYDYAERIKGVYRYQYIPKHKSNLFSIRIRNSNLNNEYFGSDKADIQKSINNIIRNIVKKITPIHTQLFNITWIDD